MYMYITSDIMCIVICKIHITRYMLPILLPKKYKRFFFSELNNFPLQVTLTVDSFFIVRT